MFEDASINILFSYDIIDGYDVMFLCFRGFYFALDIDFYDTLIKKYGYDIS